VDGVTRTRDPASKSKQSVKWINKEYCGNCDLAIDMVMKLDFMAGGKYHIPQFIQKADPKVESSRDAIKRAAFFDHLDECPDTAGAEFKTRKAAMNATLTSEPVFFSDLRGMTVDCVERTGWEKTDHDFYLLDPVPHGFVKGPSVNSPRAELRWPWRPKSKSARLHVLFVLIGFTMPVMFNTRYIWAITSGGGIRTLPSLTETAELCAGTCHLALGTISNVPSRRRRWTGVCHS
jgi:hypothetical protein